MKKLVLLLAVVAANSIFTGCTKTEDALANTDPIIGKWSLMTQYENEKPFVITDCSKNNSLEFRSDATFSVIDFEPIATTCTNFSQNGTWVREYTSKYVQTIGESKTNFYPTFAEKNTQLIIEETFGTKVIKRVYKKI